VLHAPLLNIIDTIRSLGWSGAFDLFHNGIIVGSIYALIALGYTMVYGILKLLNFAHGDIYMVGAFLGYGVLVSLGGPLHPDLPLVPLLIVVFLGAMLGAGVLGVVVERFAYRPLRNAPRIAPLISALGVAFFLENSVLLLTGGQFYGYDTFELGSKNFNPGPLLSSVFHVAGVRVTVVEVLVVSMSLALMIGLTLLVSRTRLGKAMRATAYDREAASMMGIDTDRVISATFFIGSLLAGAGGVMFGLYVLGPEVYYFVGFLAGLKAFTAAVVGGIGSIPGAMAGGLLIGLVEQFSIGYVGGQWSDVVVFGILILFLLIRPSGLFGSRAIQKV